MFPEKIIVPIKKWMIFLIKNDDVYEKDENPLKESKPQKKNRLRR